MARSNSTQRHTINQRLTPSTRKDDVGTGQSVLPVAHYCMHNLAAGDGGVSTRNKARGAESLKAFDHDSMTRDCNWGHDAQPIIARELKSRYTNTK